VADSPATTEDIESRWRRLTSTEDDIASTRLDDAWRRLRREIPDLESRMSTDDDLTADAVQVLADAVIRLLMSMGREGSRKGSVTIDDRTRSWEFDDAIRYDLYFTPGEIASLLPRASGNTGPRAFSVQPT
jgi:hypothetical protein